MVTNLFLELLRIGPAVVAFAKSDVSAPALIKVVQGVCHDSQILIVSNIANAVRSGMPEEDQLNDVIRVVGGMIV